MGAIRQILIPSVAAAIGLLILLNLGFWQLDRLAWKESLVVQVEEGVSKAPVPAPEPDAWSNLSEADDYRHVELKGSFLTGATFYFTALAKPVGPQGGPGLMAYAPFETADGWLVLINRGFLPQVLSDNEKLAATEPPLGELTISGLLRLSEKPNWTTPEADPADRIWFARDTAAMGDLLGLKQEILAPFSIDLDAEFTPASGLPQAGETIVQFKNDHLGYALTWFGLAATLVGVFLAYAATILWPRKKPED
jgi:surfeit locus 1 family protein